MIEYSTANFYSMKDEKNEVIITENDLDITSNESDIIDNFLSHPNINQFILKLHALGITPHDDVRAYNVGNSNYSSHTIQPWSVWLDWNLNAWDADIVKRVLRTKGERKLDYEKIIHICKERLRQLECSKL